MTRILGLDWATEPSKRALVQLDLMDDGRTFRVTDVLDKVSDDEVRDVCTASSNSSETATVVAVDTPFGWPRAFSAFVAKWTPQSASMRPPETDDFRFRKTDQVVRKELHKEPLSVAADRIALSARCFAEILAEKQLGDRVDVKGALRTSGPTIIEVYPGASAVALCDKDQKHLVSKYKGTSEARRLLVEHVVERTGIDLGQHKRKIVGEGKRSDETDAFLAAVTGAIYFCDVTGQASLGSGWSIRRPDDGAEKAAAPIEGWIFFPVRGPRSRPTER